MTRLNSCPSSARSLRRHGVTRAAFFGSVARGQESENSDVDILVEFAPGHSLLDQAALELDPIALFGREVEIVTYQSLNPHIRQHALDEQAVILERGARVLLENILECAQRIDEYTSPLRKDKFLASSQAQDAVIRRLEIIGEAVRACLGIWKDAHPEVEWRQIARMRDLLIQRYFSVDLDLTWTMARNDVPTLAQQVSALLLNCRNEAIRWRRPARRDAPATARGARGCSRSRSRSPARRRRSPSECRVGVPAVMPKMVSDNSPTARICKNEVSWTRVMKLFVSGGVIMRNACGSTICGRSGDNSSRASAPPQSARDLPPERRPYDLGQIGPIIYAKTNHAKKIPVTRPFCSG